MKRSLLVAVFSVWMVCSFANDTLTRARVYNFNVGDTFDYKETREWDYTAIPGGTKGNYYYFNRYVIENNFYSSLADTLFIARREISITPNQRDTLVIAKLDSFEIFLYPQNYYVSYITDTNPGFNGHIKNTVITNGLGFGSTHVFAEDVGLVSYSGGSGDGMGTYSTDGKELVYYSKGSERWGTPYTLLTGVEEIRNSQSAICISPNPATTTITLQLQQTPATATAFQLFDITGRMVLQKPLTETTNRIDLNGVSKGMYLYNVLTEGEKAGAGKLIVE